MGCTDSLRRLIWSWLARNMTLDCTHCGRAFTHRHGPRPRLCRLCLDSQLSNVVLHVGLHKTGSTSIQSWLRDHEELLCQYGIWFPRGWLQLNNHFELPLAFMRLDRMTNARRRSDEWRSAEWRAGLVRQVRSALVRHPAETTVLSAENLSWLRYDDEFEPLRELVGDAEIVMFIRNPDDLLASLHRHFHKNGFEGVSDDPDAYNYVKPDSWLVDFDSRIADWKRWFTRVQVLDYDLEAARDGSIAAFVRSLGLPVGEEVFEYRRWNTETDDIQRPPGNRDTTGQPFGM